ncbi:uncharacterized protein BCR38DRAFT_527287 [Pseudomassariella vexata]|uniref:Uncharacterized protein n=1 Tax=Pseudomassariella vexata TaxID=1141098 RepID=A0A1Y2DHN9_9PEZI|nr:uncharacterized protein BCR38DRAFT_527287 [Pseudomassariella vexata]ORY58740.1 hypothetical protein BCR38DRAFT_527287 [Pseudomassariella vexata]
MPWYFTSLCPSTRNFKAKSLDEYFIKVESGVFGAKQDTADDDPSGSSRDSIEEHSQHDKPMESPHQRAPVAEMGSFDLDIRKKFVTMGTLEPTLPMIPDQNEPVWVTNDNFRPSGHSKRPANDVRSSNEPKKWSRISKNNESLDTTLPIRMEDTRPGEFAFRYEGYTGVYFLRCNLQKCKDVEGDVVYFTEHPFRRFDERAGKHFMNGHNVTTKDEIFRRFAHRVVGTSKQGQLNRHGDELFSLLTQVCVEIQKR